MSMTPAPLLAIGIAYYLFHHLGTASAKPGRIAIGPRPLRERAARAAAVHADGRSGAAAGPFVLARGEAAAHSLLA